MTPHLKHVVIALLATTAVHAADFSGRLYERGSHRSKLLFTNQNRDIAEGDAHIGRTVFKDPEGHEVVVEETRWGPQGLESFSVDQLQTGEKGSVRLTRDKALFSYFKDGKTETAEESRPDNFLVPGALSGYVHAHWAALQKGESVQVRLAVLERLETVGFKLVKARDVTVAGRKAVVITMSASAFFIGFVVKPLSFTFSEDGLAIYEIDGRISPKLRRNGRWVDAEADSVFTAP